MTWALYRQGAPKILNVDPPCATGIEPIEMPETGVRTGNFTSRVLLPRLHIGLHSARGPQGKGYLGPHRDNINRERFAESCGKCPGFFTVNFSVSYGPEAARATGKPAPIILTHVQAMYPPLAGKPLERSNWLRGMF